VANKDCCVIREQPPGLRSAPSRLPLLFFQFLYIRVYLRSSVDNFIMKIPAAIQIQNMSYLTLPGRPNPDQKKSQFKPI
jgi:hypothetical protein